MVKVIITTVLEDVGPVILNLSLWCIKVAWETKEQPGRWEETEDTQDGRTYNCYFPSITW